MGDLTIAMQASRTRSDHAQQLAAWHVCHVINLVSKRRVRVSDLLPSLKAKGPKVFTPQMFGGNIDAMKAAIQREIDAREERELLENG